MGTDQRTTTRPAREPEPWLITGVPHGLPLGLPELVGRSRELKEIVDLFPAARLVTLTGPAGIGKTRLALEVAHRLRANYSGSAWFVDLAPVTDPELVAFAVGAALGLDPEPGREPLEALSTYLQERTAVLVLDNCEHLVTTVAVLAQRLWDECPDLAVLATSRQALGIPVEHAEVITPLSLPEPRPNPSIASALESDAIRLFCARAVASHGGFRLTDDVVPGVAEICHRLDGIPLAIELAAARAAVLGPAEIAERIEQRFDLLTQGDSAAPARHQTLRAALDWSYELLSDEEAALLRRLSVFTGTAGLQAVEEICAGDGVAVDDVVDLLSSLVSKSLLVADTSKSRARYHLLETIRAYGGEHLQESGEQQQLLARLTAWCISLVEGQHGRAKWTATLETDHDNVRAAMQWAVSNDPPSGLRLAAAMIPFWRARGYFREGQHWLERMLEADSAPPAAVRARALWGLGMLRTLQGDVDSGRVPVEESLAIAREAKLSRAELHALNLLGFISIFTQNPMAAKPLLEQSVAMARAAGDGDSLATTLALCGRVHLFLGEIDQARAVFEECLSLSVDDPANALIGLGWGALGAGEDNLARELFEQALSALRESDERFDVAMVLSFLGELAWVRGDLAEARELLEDGRELAEAMGAPYPLARCLHLLASVAASENDGATAVALAEEACEIAEGAHLPYALVRALHARGDLKGGSGDIDGAKDDYDRALSVARTNGDRDGEVGSLQRLATLATDSGTDGEALSLLHEALLLQTDAGDARVASLLEAMAGMGADQGRPAHAARLFGAAEALRQSRGNLRRPHEVAGYSADVDHLLSVMDEAEGKEAWTEGHALSRDDAVSLALRGRGARDPNRPAFGWSSLTPTERRIVDLAAEGFTNREIADKLFVSDRTVQGHLGRVFRKLGITSRRELREAYRSLEAASE